MLMVSKTVKKMESVSMYERVNASKDVSFSTSFWGNSCRGCLESRGLNSHPDTLKMVSRIKRLCLKP